MAISEGTSLPGEALPVLVTDLTEAEADKLLATYDPIGAMATRDDETLRALLATISTQDDGLRRLLEDLGKASGPVGLDPDEVTPPTQTDIKSGDLFLLGRHRLLCGTQPRRRTWRASSEPTGPIS